MLKVFPCSGVELKSIVAKVNWSYVCTPKNEGGLGMKPLKERNKATVLRNLWAICKKAYTLWVMWVHSYVIEKP